MSHNINTGLGAAIAALIGFLTGFMALMQQEGVGSIGDISEAAWYVLTAGGVLAFLKDYQAISTRRGINRFTKSGDGGGEV